MIDHLVRHERRGTARGAHHRNRHRNNVIIRARNGDAYSVTINGDDYFGVTAGGGGEQVVLPATASNETAIAFGR